MRFHWLKDRIAQKQFSANWAPGKENLADYTTKFHIPAHHRQMRPIQLYVEGQSPSTLKGCIRIMNEPRNRATCLAQLSYRIGRLRTQ